jgi:hypothetical protein
MLLMSIVWLDLRKTSRQRIPLDSKPRLTAYYDITLLHC